jgi:hypothetical protein
MLQVLLEIGPDNIFLGVIECFVSHLVMLYGKLFR